MLYSETLVPLYNLMVLLDALITCMILSSDPNTLTHYFNLLLNHPSTHLYEVTCLLVCSCRSLKAFIYLYVYRLKKIIRLVDCLSNVTFLRVQ